MVAEARAGKIILAHKFDEKIIAIVRSRLGQNLYRYSNSKRGLVDLKIRLYCIAIFYLFKELQKHNNIKEVNLDICRDFWGNEVWIKQSLIDFLKAKLKFSVTIRFSKMPDGSIADNWAYLINRDKCKKFDKYCIKIELGEFEKFLKK